MAGNAAKAAPRGVAAQVIERRAGDRRIRPGGDQVGGRGRARAPIDDRTDER